MQHTLHYASIIMAGCKVAKTTLKSIRQQTRCHYSQSKVMTYMTDFRRDSMNGAEDQTRLCSNSTVFQDTRNLALKQNSDPMGLETNSEQDQADSQNPPNMENQLNDVDSLGGEAIALELDRLERRIEKGLKAFCEIGQSLGEIRDRRLYRQAYKTFEEYCLNRWEISPRSAYRLIQAALVYENVTRGSQIPENVTHRSHFQILPTNERQIRPLATLPPEKQREAWAKAVSTAPGGKVTSGHVAQIVREYQRENSGNKSRKNYSFDKQQQSTDNSQQSLTRSCWNCCHCSRELLDDPQSFYCYRLGKLSFIEKDGNQRGAECEFWTDRFADSSEVRKNLVPLRETFDLTLKLPCYLQPLIQDAAKESGLTVMDWFTKLVEETVSKKNGSQSIDIDENFIDIIVSEVA